MWYVSHANSDHIKRVIDLSDLESTLNNFDVNDQVSRFNSTIMNIITNVAPNETITCDDQGTA